MWRFVSLSAVFLVQVVAFAPPDQPGLLQRIQDGSADVCWSPDHEWPVPCDED